MLLGESGVFSLALSWQVRMFLRGFRIHNIDCALRFNAFALVDEAYRNNLQPELVLMQTKIQRAFTPYQLLDVIGRLARLRAPTAPGEVFFLLAPLKQFFDRDVGEQEGAYLLERLFRMLTTLRDRQVPLFIVEANHYEHANHARALEQLQSLAPLYWELQSRPTAGGKTQPPLRIRRSFTALMQGQRGLALSNNRYQTNSGGGILQDGPNTASLFHADPVGRGAPEAIQKRTA